MALPVLADGGGDRPATARPAAGATRAGHDDRAEAGRPPPRSRSGSKAYRPGKELTSIEASFDDGQTWQEVPVQAGGDGWLATVDNPGSGFVSLLAKATADEGSAVTHTFIRAYALVG